MKEVWNQFLEDLKRGYIVDTLDTIELLSPQDLLRLFFMYLDKNGWIKK